MISRGTGLGSVALAFLVEANVALASAAPSLCTGKEAFGAKRVGTGVLTQASQLLGGAAGDFTQEREAWDDSASIWN